MRFCGGKGTSRGSFTHFGSLACKLVHANVRKKLCIVAKISVQLFQFCVQRSSFSVRIHISDIKCNRLTYLNGALFSFFFMHTVRCIQEPRFLQFVYFRNLVCMHIFATCNLFGSMLHAFAILAATSPTVCCGMAFNAAYFTIACEY